MSTDPNFGDRVVITSSSTRVDTDRLVGAAVRVSDGIGDAQWVMELVTDARSQCATHARLVPVETAQALDALDLARSVAASLASRLVSLADALTFSALVYCAAEGDATRFEAVWRQLRPDASTWWDTGIMSVHSRAGAWSTLPGNSEDAVPAFVLNAMNPPLMREVGLISAVAGHAVDFLGGDPGDGTEMMRTQLDMDALASRLVEATITAGVEPAWRQPSRASANGSPWWGQRASDLRQAAVLASIWGLGAGRVMKGQTRGVSVSARVPGDARTVTSQVPSDPDEGGLAVFASPFAGGVGALPSAVASGLASLSVSQDPAVHASASIGASMGAAGSVTSTPRSPAALLGRIRDLASTPDHGQVEILRHDTGADDGSARTSWSVVIRGTQRWTAGGANPQDLLTNIEGVAGEDSDQTRAVREAMDMAGIGADEPVEFTGHSQGGIIAAQLATDSEVTSRYTVASVLTAGGPTGGSAPGPDVHMLNLENTRDPVPGLDGMPNSDLDASLTVSFDGGLVTAVADGQPPATPHDLGLYQEAMQWLEAHHNDLATDEVTEWIHHRDEALGLTDTTRTTALHFDTRREGVIP